MNTDSQSERDGEVVDTPQPLSTLQLLRPLLLLSEQQQQAQQAQQAHSPQSHVIYILRLEGNRYYVGRSASAAGAEERVAAHFGGRGSAYTRSYPPLSLEATMRTSDPFAEDTVTAVLMDAYGVDRVRGGSYCCVGALDDSVRADISRRLRTARNECFRCLRSGHVASACNARASIMESQGSTSHVEDSEGSKDTEPMEKLFDMSDKCDSGRRTTPYLPVACMRCGRYGHASSACVARNHAVSGMLLLS